jgi:hypothetical protein
VVCAILRRSALCPAFAQQICSTISKAPPPRDADRNLFVGGETG